MYEAMNDSKDVIALITMIRVVDHQHDDTTQKTMALVTDELDFYTRFMNSEDDTEELYGTFNAMADTINFHGRSAVYHPQIYTLHLTLLCVQREPDTTTISKDELEKVQKDAKKSACEEYLSCLFILDANSGRLQGLKRALNNQFLLDKYSYPTTVPHALKLLDKFKAEVGTTPKGHAEPGVESGVFFAQAQSWAQMMVFHHNGVKRHGVYE